MRRLLLATLALATFTGSAGAVRTVAPTDWKQAPYFDVSTSELRLQTTQSGWDSTHKCDWTGPAGGTYYTNVNGPDYSGFGCVSNYLWAKTCTPGPQTVTFTKKLFLPGGASDLAVSLQSYGDKPLTMGIDINGRVALSTAKSVHKLDLKAKGHLFKHGMNTITVRAKKGASGKGPCNANGTEYAVFAQINARFTADMVATTPVQDGLGFAGSFTVRNAGPSDASYTTVGYGAYTSHLTDISAKLNIPGARIIMSGPGIDLAKCQHSYSAIYFNSVSYTGYSVSCPMTPLKAGESATIKVTYGYTSPAGPFYDEWPITYGVSSDLPDPNSANSGATRPRLQSMCLNDPAKPDPRCKS